MNFVAQFKYKMFEIDIIKDTASSEIAGVPLPPDKTNIYNTSLSYHHTNGIKMMFAHGYI